MFCENLQFSASLHFLYAWLIVVRCMGIGLGMSWVGSWVHKFTWQWVGLGVGR